MSQICCGQISLQSAAVNCSFSENLTPLGVTFILLDIVLKRMVFLVFFLYESFIFEIVNCQLIVNMQ